MVVYMCSDRVSAIGFMLGVPLSLAAQTGPPPPPLFEDVTAAVGLAGAEANRVAFADFNGDGYPDILVGYTGVFLSERGQRFTRTESHQALAPEGRRGPNVVQAGDVNNDGFLDLYLGRYP